MVPEPVPGGGGSTCQMSSTKPASPAGGPLSDPAEAGQQPRSGQPLEPVPQTIPVGQQTSDSGQ